MNLDDFITFLGWVTLASYWGYFNHIFADVVVVGEAINEAIREEFFQEIKAEDTEQPEDES